MNLPENDMRALLCIAPEAALKMASVIAIKRAWDALETADYAAFWELTKEKDMAEICSTVPAFEDQVSHRIVVMQLYISLYNNRILFHHDLLWPPPCLLRFDGSFVAHLHTAAAISQDRLLKPVYLLLEEI